ncbi:MAG: hypothetical protein QNJ19_10505 [Woeseiaceae bacterium]|nr:hypothetical protein [Woeseiaceae bacterium]
MASDRTITENDLEANAQSLINALRSEPAEAEPDLSVDGLSESILSRFLGLFGSRS